MIRSRLTYAACLLAGAFTISTGNAGELSNGQQLHDENCTACHDSGMYTRDDRKVNTLDALGGQVRRCEINLELQWFDDDVNDVVEHLNASFYKFD